MTMAIRLPTSPAPLRETAITFTRLYELAQRAITANTALTSACIPGRAISDVQFARIDLAAYQARRDLLDCLRCDHGIDAAMADQLGALL